MDMFHNDKHRMVRVRTDTLREDRAVQMLTRDTAALVCPIVHLRHWLPHIWILLTCLAPQCTDVGSAHPLRYVGPPTSPLRPSGTITERPPS